MIIKTRPRHIFQFGALFLILTLFSCSKNNGSSAINEIPVFSLSDAQDLARSSAVTCSGADCHASVGMLVASKQTSLSTCTAFVVGPDLILTNSHCIPSDLKNPLHYVSCEDRIKVLFPTANGFRGSEIACASLVNFSPAQTTKDQDFALIRLKQRVSRPALSISQAGVENGADFDAYKVNPTSNTEPKGKLEHVSCHAISGSYALPEYTSKFSLVTSLTDCNIVPGNSGSPLLNSSGDVSAIVQAMATETNNPALKSALGHYLETPNLSALLFASNMACINAPILSLSAKTDCSSDSSNSNDAQAAAALLNLKNLEQNNPDQLQKENVSAMNMFSAWIASNSKIFQWEAGEISSTTSSKKLIPVPQCVRDKTIWGSDYKAPWFDIFHTFQTKAELPFADIPAALVQIYFNQYLQPDTQTSADTTHAALKIVWNPENAAKKGSTGISMLENDEEIYQGTIKTCN